MLQKGGAKDTDEEEGIYFSKSKMKNKNKKTQNSSNIILYFLIRRNEGGELVLS